MFALCLEISLDFRVALYGFSAGVFRALCAFRWMICGVLLRVEWVRAVSRVVCMVCRLSIPSSCTCIHLTGMRASCNLFLGRLGRERF